MNIFTLNGSTFTQVTGQLNEIAVGSAAAVGD